jgi:hypothetical protein
VSNSSTLFGFATQIDIGNAMVGIGTMALAFVSFFVASRNNSKQAEIVYSNHIIDWIKDLRNDTALFVKLHQNIMLVRRDTQSGELPKAERDILLCLSEVRARLKMMIKIDSKNKKESLFLELISQDVSDDEEQAKKQRQEIIDASRAIQKNEWHEAKQKIK